MKTMIGSIIIVLLIGLLVNCCENDITGQLISNSTCKNDLKTTSGIVETPDSLSCIEYTFDKEKNKLVLKHINAGFNCCPEDLYCKISYNGDTIQIQEFEKSAQCNCNCLYDLDIEINGVEMKEYHIKLVEPYTAEMAKILFEIDLVNNNNGSYCVTRKQYPWGIKSLNE